MIYLKHNCFKGIITIEDWAKIGSHIQYDYLKDGLFLQRGRNFKRKIICTEGPRGPWQSTVRKKKG